MNKIALDFVSVHGVGWSGHADMVIARGAGGELGIVAGHAPLVTTLRPGEVRIVNDKTEELYYVAGGILEVQPDRITILADEVVRTEDLDPVDVEKRRVSAEKILHETQASDLEFLRARLELSKALAQQQSLRRLRRG